MRVLGIVGISLFFLSFLSYFLLMHAGFQGTQNGLSGGPVVYGWEAIKTVFISYCTVPLYPVCMLYELLFAVLYIRKQGKTLWNVLQDIYAKYGYFNEDEPNIVLEGIEGAERIKRMMSTVRENLPTEVGGAKVVKVADYIKNTGNHVLYRVTPCFYREELLARGVHMEAYSTEDNGEGICFNVFVYNVQPGIEIDYKTGDNWKGKDYEKYQ